MFNNERLESENIDYHLLQKNNPIWSNIFRVKTNKTIYDVYVTPPLCPKNKWRE